MLAQDLCRKADCLVRFQCTVSVYIQGQLIIIGNLAHTGILYSQVYSFYRRIDRIHSDHTDRHIVALSFVSADVTASFGDGQFHVQLAVGTAVQCRDHLIRIHDLNILIYLNVRCSDNTFTFELNICNLGLIGLAVIADRKAFQVHNNFRHIFLDTRNRTELMQNALNLYLAHCCARQRRKHNSAQRITKSSTIAALQGFYNESSVLLVIRNLCNFNFRFVKIKHSKAPPFTLVGRFTRYYLEYSSTICTSSTGTSIASLVGASFTVPFRASRSVSIHSGVRRPPVTSTISLYL